MLLKEIEFNVPKDLIAQQALLKRDQARLLVCDRQTGEVKAHVLFKDIVKYIKPGDCLVINNTRVMPARIFGNKSTGGKVEVLLVRSLSNARWECLLKPRLPAGSLIYFSDNLIGEITHKNEFGRYEVTWNSGKKLTDHIAWYGVMPLPPYIKRNNITNQVKKNDLKMYQTVYAKHPGSIAAPTAGLHFTSQLLTSIKSKGVKIVEIMLHVGVGTFKKITSSDINEHVMDAEYYNISDKSAEEINHTRQNHGRIIAVGTTTVRALESAVNSSGILSGGDGWTDIFIKPGFQFNVIDGMITNFHLPQHSPFVMTAAVIGLRELKRIYKEAIQRKYRFYSYGDAMLII
ncbi:MAG: tRNA preQ1(34) S-adenosylmethionine ribosyltransferase-isomerase QueA [bacterium]